MVQVLVVILILASVRTIADWIMPDNRGSASTRPEVQQFIERQEYSRAPEYPMSELERRIDCQEQRYWDGSSNQTVGNFDAWIYGC